MSLDGNTTRAAGEHRMHGIGGISNKDMALTQIALIGYPLTMPKIIGIRITPKKEEALIHLWRVIGYMMGIPNR